MAKGVAYDPLPAVVAVACGYESLAIAVALLTGKEYLPTITSLQHRYRPLGWIVVGWLSYHFLYHEERRHEEMVAQAADSAAARAVGRARALGMLQRPAR